MGSKRAFIKKALKVLNENPEIQKEIGEWGQA
jgi:hypothetical protein